MVKNKINILLLIMLIVLIIWQYSDVSTKVETSILQAMAQMRQPAVTEWVITITNSVSIIHYSALSLLLCGLYYIKYKKIPWLLPLPLIINAIVFYIMKIIIHRPRPITMLVQQHDFSFPSGHTLSAMMMVYVIFIFIQTMFSNVKSKNTLIVGCLYIIVIIITRLYLGVHYPTDIVASLLLGCLIVVNSYTYLLKKLVL